MNYSKILTITLLLFIGISAFGQNSRAERKARKKEKKEMLAFKVDSLIKTRDINLTVYKIMPQGLPFKQTSGGYYLSIKNDILNCYLPYYGESTSAASAITGHLSLTIANQKIEIVENEYSKKFGFVLNFLCEDDYTKEIWEVTMQIQNDGSGRMSCKTNAKDQISYEGDITIP